MRRWVCTATNNHYTVADADGNLTASQTSLPPSKIYFAESVALFSAVFSLVHFLETIFGEKCDSPPLKRIMETSNFTNYTYVFHVNTMSARYGWH